MERNDDDGFVPEAEFDDCYDAGAGAMRAIRLLGGIGFLAKGIIFGLVGALLLIAAWGARASLGGLSACGVFIDVPSGGLRSCRGNVARRFLLFEHSSHP